jgi:MoaA/NifB/PqqE/SkfB family radical SAM enzyme
MKAGHVIENLPILILYPHSRCNCRCVMCDIWKVETVQEISLSDLERHARDIEVLGVRWVVFSGGEPLMHSDLFRLGDSLRKRGIRTTILSTGLLLAGNASSVTHSLDDVIVSLDGPPQTHDRIRRVRGAFELLAEGVRAVHALKPAFPIGARTTVQKENLSLLRETVHTAKGLGLQWISFLAVDLTSAAFNRTGGWPAARQGQAALTAEETNRLEDEIEQLIDELPGHQGFVLETPEKLRRIVHHFRAHLGLVEPVAPRCNAPWVSAVVESDGTVRPCFFHKSIGSVRELGLYEVLNGPQAMEFRQTLDVSRDPICRRCVCSLYLADKPRESALQRETPR